MQHSRSPAKRKSLSEMLGLLASSQYCATDDGLPDIMTHLSDYQINPVRGPSVDSETTSIKLFLDDQERFNEKAPKIISALKDSTNTCIFLDEDSPHLERVFTPFFETEKSTIYHKYFSPFIKLHWSVDKKAGVVKITQTSGYREKNEGCPIDSTQSGVIHQRIPTFTHLAISRLIRRGIFHKVITTSTTNQLRVSGIPEESLIELHGNVFREACHACGNYEKISDRDLTKELNHEVSTCELCGEKLKILYTESGGTIPLETVDRVRSALLESQFSLIFDSAYMEAPFCELPYQSGVRLVSCGLVGVPRREKYSIAMYRPCYDLLIHLLNEFDIHLNK
jgi:NAD-dependent SIR2 family protein deacetylase